MVCGPIGVILFVHNMAKKYEITIEGDGVTRFVMSITDKEYEFLQKVAKKSYLEADDWDPSMRIEEVKDNE